MFRAGSAASIRPLTNMRWTRAEAVPSGPGWVRVTRISGPASGARPPARVMASSKVTGPVAWKGEGQLDGASHGDGVAVVFGHVDRNERVHDDLLVLQSFGNCRLEFSRHQALRLHPLFEHRKADESVGTYAHRAGQFRRVVYRDSDQ